MERALAGETSSIAKMAVHVSNELLEWFRWRRIPLPDLNFDCVKTAAHAAGKDSHTHPVDAVFHYVDPYLNRIVYFNTDLKSYASSSIDANRMYAALKSLALTIDCARVSEEWQDRYHLLGDLPYEVRGMLFVYNHDADYDKNFYDVLSTPVKRQGAKEKTSVKLESLPIADGQVIHVFEPTLISYLTTVVTDAHRLHTAGTFPEKNYEFYYPDLRLHKASGAVYERPATAEIMAGPYLIIRHDQIKKLNENTGDVEIRYPDGYVIYYNRPGASAEEFAYFLDVLSGYQILDGHHKIRVRVAHHAPAADPKSNFKRAIALYAQEWGFDDIKLKRLESIEIELVEIYRYSFSKTNIGWER